MLALIRRAGQSLWLRRNSPEVWLLISNLLSRFLGFWITLLVSRHLGVQALGLYSGVLITASSPTVPISSVLANNATMMATRLEGEGGLWPILRAQRVVLLLGLCLSGLGGAFMLHISGLHTAGFMPGYVVWVAGGGLIAGQLLTQSLLGAFHGADLTLSASRLVSLVTIAAVLSALPVIWGMGLSGLLMQAMLVALVPGVLLSLRAWQKGRGRLQNQLDKALQKEAFALLVKALPSVGATVLNNATNWLACIYLVERHHGQVGLGLVALGLQWMAVMLLPLSSWSARIMRALTLARQAGEDAFWVEVHKQVMKCFLVSLAGGVCVMILIVPIGVIYKIPVNDILGLFFINAVACSISAVSFVYERVFYCSGRQKPWLWFSFVAYAVQLLVTYCMMPATVLAVPLGNLSAIVMLVVSSWWYWRRFRVRTA